LGGTGLLPFLFEAASVEKWKMHKDAFRGLMGFSVGKVRLGLIRVAELNLLPKIHVMKQAPK
jgi:hypothetical protein